MANGRLWNSRNGSRPVELACCGLVGRCWPGSGRNSFVGSIFELRKWILLSIIVCICVSLQSKLGIPGNAQESSCLRHCAQSMNKSQILPNVDQEGQ
jgi:hypothetical protein